MSKNQIKFFFIDKLTDSLLWFLRKLNRHKDNSLAYRLHSIADEYDTRPSGLWS